MRNYYALFFVFLFSLFSCEQDDNFPQVENTISGKKMDTSNRELSSWSLLPTYRIGKGKSIWWCKHSL